jgi:ABC-type lipoprotein release transport system permease subunit
MMLLVVILMVLFLCTSQIAQFFCATCDVRVPCGLLQPVGAHASQIAQFFCVIWRVVGVFYAVAGNFIAILTV